MGEKLNPSKGGFESKPAPNSITGKNATQTFKTECEPGAGEVGNHAENPYGTSKQK